MSGPVRLVVTRPLEDARPLAATLEAMGHEVLVEPMLSIRSETGWSTDTGGAGSVAFTSANGVRAWLAADGTRDLTAWCVGPATAAAARAAGFGTVHEAGGDVASLAAHIIEQAQPDAGTVLHVAGKHRAGDLAGRLGEAGVKVTSLHAYTAIPADRASSTLLGWAKDAQNRAFGVLVFSPRTARLFVDVLTQSGLADDLPHGRFFCLSDGVGAPLREAGARSIAIASRPTEQALLALLPTP
ncbi:MAG: uroporphyrinogen-III synthase [Pseudomonadota bacterium]